MADNRENININNNNGQQPPAKATTSGPAAGFVKQKIKEVSIYIVVT